MELILDIFWEKRRVYIDWKQIICAVVLAFLIAGLYNYVNAQPDYAEEFVKEQAVPAENLPAIVAFNSVLLPSRGNAEEEDKGLKCENNPESDSEGKNFAVSYGYSAAESDNRTKSAKSVKKTATNAVNPKIMAKADDHTKHMTEALPDIPTADAIATNPDIAAGVKDNVRSAGNNKTKPDAAKTNNKIAADTNKTEPDRTTADTDNTGIGHVTLIESFPGFLANEKGHIAGYTDASKVLKDHLVTFPRDTACTGIEKNALKGLESDIYEIYIPANILYIAEGAFDDLNNLFFIEAAPDNPRFYSENGILYYRNGKVAAFPNRLKK